MAKQCNACGGVYEPLGTDGVAYYHACPPITRVPVVRDGLAQLVDLADLQPTDSIRVRRGAELLTVVNQDKLPDDVRIGDVLEPRANHRDETPVPVFNGKTLSSQPKIETVGATTITITPADPLDVFKDAK